MEKQEISLKIPRLLTLNALKKYHELVLRITVLQSPVILQSSGLSAGVETNVFNIIRFSQSQRLDIYLFV